MNSQLTFNEWTEYVKFGTKYEPTPESTRFIEKYIDGQTLMLAGGTQEQEQRIDDYNPSTTQQIKTYISNFLAKFINDKVQNKTIRRFNGLRLGRLNDNAHIGTNVPAQKDKPANPNN